MIRNRKPRVSAMIALLLMMMVVSVPIDDPLDEALQSFRGVSTYRVTIRSGGDSPGEIIRYHYRKPGYVRMDFIKPHKGAALTYDPLKRTVALRPFGIFSSFLLSLSPDNSLVTSSRGHRVDSSDIGALLGRVQKLQKQGTTVITGEERVGGNGARVVVIEGNGDSAVEGIHRYVLWLDKKTGLPLKTMAYGISGDLVEDVLMDDLEINIPLQPGLFTL